MSRAGLLALAGTIALVVACNSPPPIKPGGGPAPVARPGAASASASAMLPPTQVTEYAENDFTESDHTRDPFRSFAGMFIADKSKTQARQVDVVLSQYSIDELKLVAIVQSGDYPRAMLVDPTSKGWVLKRGDYVGRPDTVHTGGGTSGADYQVYWRVDRIRDGDIVLTREDPAQPGQPPATRVLPLHPETEEKGT
jgi:type IV pilus assembly protein PilP